MPANFIGDKSDLLNLIESPNLFIETAIKDFVANSPDNRLENGPIFDEPLVAFADGDDPLFNEYKKIIGKFHFTPREIFELAFKNKDGWKGQPEKVSVIAWVLPVTKKTRQSMYKEATLPSLPWNLTRWHGEEFNKKVGEHVIELLESSGYKGVAPHYTDFFHIVEHAEGLSSVWSQRHICYAAGLGTFSLSDGFITARGIAHRCGSVVCDLALVPSPRIYTDYHANCRHFQGKSCMHCIKRCPAGAISQQGHDKKKCREYLFAQMEQIKQSGRQGYIGRYMGCGLCQTKVPCEDKIQVK